MEKKNGLRLLKIFSLAFTLALTGAVTPGPVLALVIGQVLAQGLAAAVFILLGHAVLELFLLTGLAFGFTRFLRNSRVQAWMGLVGGVVLIWMGQDIFRSAAGAVLPAGEAAALGWLKLILAGIGVSLSNPYFTGWWATIGTGQIASLRLRRKGEYAAFFAGHELGDFAWYMFVAVILTVGRQWLTGDVYTVILKVCGALILVLGAVFIGAALVRLRKNT
mgnify:CR=1 FL=1